MGIVVQKYGGTSVGNVERIQNVAKRIQQTVERGEQVVAVVSAMGKTTDDLISLAHSITEDSPPREMDMLLMTGEQVSMSLLSMALYDLGIPSVSLTGWQAGIETEAEFGNARILDIEPKRILDSLEEGKVVIVAGFQGVTPEEEVVTLGRGGSDTTAVAIAGAIDAERCEINTDVDGIYTTDPRIVPNAQKLSSISHDEMLDLAALGAVVIHPRAVECAKVHGVKLVVQSSFKDTEGTYIKERTDMEKDMVVTGVTRDLDIVKVKLLQMPNESGIMSKLCHLLAERNINVDMILQSEHGADKINIAFTINEQDKDKTVAILEEHREDLRYENVFFESNLAKVSIVGAGMITNPGVAARMFDELANHKIDIKMTNTSEIKISCMVPEEHANEAVRILHAAYGLDVQEEQPAKSIS